MSAASCESIVFVDFPTVSVVRTTLFALETELEKRFASRLWTISPPSVSQEKVEVRIRVQGSPEDQWFLVKCLLEVSSIPGFADLAAIIWDNDGDFLDALLGTSTEETKSQFKSEYFIRQGKIGIIPPQKDKTLELIARSHSWSMHEISEEAREKLAIRLSIFPPVKLYRDPLLDEYDVEKTADTKPVLEASNSKAVLETSDSKPVLQKFFGTVKVRAILSSKTARLFTAYPSLAAQALHLYCNDKGEHSVDTEFANPDPADSCLVPLTLPASCLAELMSSRARRLPKEYLTRFWATPEDCENMSEIKINDAKSLGTRLSFGLSLWSYSSLPNVLWLSFICQSQRLLIDGSLDIPWDTLRLKMLTDQGKLNREEIEKATRRRLLVKNWLYKLHHEASQIPVVEDAYLLTSLPMITGNSPTFRLSILKGLLEKTSDATVDEVDGTVKVDASVDVIDLHEFDHVAGEDEVREILRVISGGDEKDLSRILDLDGVDDESMEKILQEALLEQESDLLGGIEAGGTEKEMEALRAAFAKLGLEGLDEKLMKFGSSSDEEDGHDDDDDESECSFGGAEELKNLLIDKPPAEVFLGTSKEDSIASNFRNSMRLEYHEPSAARLLLGSLNK